MKILVNLITTFRCLYAFILAITKQKISYSAFILNVIILFLTDWIDGKLARKYKVQTLYGSIMDAVADKTLCIVLLIALVIKNRIFLTVLIAEIIIAIINSAGMITGRETSSSALGKIKMWLLSIAIVIGFMNCSNTIKIIGTTITVILQIFVIIGYTKSYFSQNGSKKEKHCIKNLEDLKFVLFDTQYYLSLI